MPTYEYQCDACEHRFEEFQSILAEPIKKCPECGKKKVRRLISAGAAVIFKGSGFYCTDYRSPSYSKAAAADKNGGSANGKAETSTKTETKAESGAKAESGSKAKGEKAKGKK
jgi:putative FmdB family regulatory protein